MAAATASSRSRAPAARCSTARRRTTGRSRRPTVEALKRWCAARLHDPRVSRLGDLPLSRRTSTTGTSSTVQRPSAALPEAMVGPDGRLRRRDGFKLTDARMNAARGAQRDPLLRALPRARQGLLLEGPAREGRRRSTVEPARHRAGRLPARREDLRDAHAAQGRATRSARWRSSSSTTRCARAPATASATTA